MASDKTQGLDSPSMDSPWLYLSKPNEFDKVRVKELYGGVPDADRLIEQKCSSILNSLQVDLNHMINLQSLLPHLISRSLLTEHEKEYMNNPHVPNDSKLLQLNTYICNKGKTGIARFYLCLMDTWGDQGLQQHYDMAVMVRKAVLTELGFNVDDVYQRETDVYEDINRMPNRRLSPELAIQLIQALGVVIRVGEDYTPELKTLCSMWLRRTDTEHTLDRLVEVLLCTPGAGHLVTGLVPICRSNPPIVSNFLRNTVKRRWERLAAYLGIPSTLVDSVKASYSSSLRRQLQRFLIVWRVPDCERLEDILYSMYDRVQSAGAGLDSSGYLVPAVEQSQGGDVDDAMLDQFSKQLQMNEECVDSRPLGYPRTGSQKIPHSRDRKVGFHNPLVSPGKEEERYGRKATDLSNTELEGSDAYVKESEGEEEKEPPPSLQPQSYEPSQDAGTDLVTSCLVTDWDCARALIESGSELEGRSQDGLTPLMICCKKGNIEMVELIINRGGTLKATDNSGQCCLHFDEVVKNLPLLKFLVECFRAADISVEQHAKNWYTPLLVACLAGERCKNAVEVLLEARADPNGHCRAAHRPLTVASAAGDSGIFHTLIDHGADIDVQDRSGCTPLLCSCLRYHHQLVEFLIARDARLNLSDNHGNTPLFACVESGAHDLVRRLLERGAPVDIIRTVTKRFMAGSVEETPLAHCCGRGDLEMAKLLVARGADINRLCAGTVPPVGFAIICWQFVMVEYMIGLDGFDKTTLGLSRPLIIGIKCENWVATHLIIVKFFGSLASAMQKANSGGYTQLYQQLLIFMEKTSGRNLDTMLESEMASAAAQREELSRTDQHDSHYTIEQNLQKFCQICVSVLKANTDLTEVASVALVEGHHHISDFFLECNTNTLSPQQLKTNLLYGQPSALRFSLENKLLTLEDFVHHTDLFFPGRADEFFTDLVHTFHEMNGGMELPTAVDECLGCLFSLQFCPGVSVGVRGYPRSYQLPESAEGAVLGPQHSVGSSSGFDPYQPYLGRQKLGFQKPALSSTTENTRFRKLTTTTTSTLTTSSSTFTTSTAAATTVTSTSTSTSTTTTSTTTTDAATTSSRDQRLSTTPPTSVEVDGQNAPHTSTVQTGETSAMNSSTVNGGQEATPTMTNNLSIETDDSLSPPAVPPQLHPPSSHPQPPPSHHLPVSAPQAAASALSSHSSPSISSHPHPHPATPGSSHSLSPPTFHQTPTAGAHISADTHSRPYTRADSDSGRYSLSSVNTTDTTPLGASPSTQLQQHPLSARYDYGHHTCNSRSTYSPLHEESSDDSESSLQRSRRTPRRKQSDGRGHGWSQTPHRTVGRHSSSLPHRTPRHHSRVTNDRVIQELKAKEKIEMTLDCEKLFYNLAEVLSGQWITLGEKLGLEDKIQALRHLHENDLDATVELLRYWVKYYEPTWHQLEDVISQLPMINHRLLTDKINHYIDSFAVTKLEIVTPDRNWAEHILHEAMERNAINVRCKYALWHGDGRSDRHRGLPQSR